MAGADKAAVEQALLEIQKAGGSAAGVPNDLLLEAVQMLALSSSRASGGTSRASGGTSRASGGTSRASGGTSSHVVAASHLSVKAQNALEQDGFALRALLHTETTDKRELGSLGALLQTDSQHLGKGKDIQKKYGPYDQLKLACAWKIDHPRTRAKYEAGLDRVSKEMELIERKGKDVSRVPGLPAKTPSRGFDLKQDANESILLHGTNPDVLLALLSTGLNERFSGTNAGTAFGDGVYLAEDVGKTDQYVTADCAYDKSSELHKRLYGRTVPHPGDVFYLLVCRAALGYSVRTQDTGRNAQSMDTRSPVFPVSFRELSPVTGVTPPIFHHSLIAELGPAIGRYREFVVFHSEYVRAEYLVAYQRFNGDARLRTT